MAVTAGHDVAVAERLAAARRRAGLSQRALAERLGVPLYGVEQMESGRSDASPYLSEISSLTGHPLAYFLGSAPTVEQAEAVEAILHESGEEDTSALVPRRYFVLGALTLLMTIRFFTETLRVLPKIVSFIDIPLFFVVLLFAAPVPVRGEDPVPLRAAKVLATLFLVVVFASVMTNLGRVEAAPALVYTYTLLSPVAIGVAIYRLWPPGNAPIVMRWLFALTIVQIVVVVIFNLPRFFAESNPDYITGTFGENGYQLVLFLLVVVAATAGLITYDAQRPIARFGLPVIIASTVVIFLVQYRTLLLTMALTVLLIGYFMRGRARGVMVGLAVTGVLLGTLYVVASNLTFLKYQQVGDIAQAGPMVFINARLDVAGDVANLYGDNARFVLTGSGPGTFSSRAFRTFSVLDNPKHTTAGSLAYDFVGGEPYRTDVSERYTVPRVREEKVIGGSLQLTQPYASYTAVAAETGMPGLLLIVALYLLGFSWAFRMVQRAIGEQRVSDPVVPVALAAAVVFFVLLQLGALENWLEATRITFFGWALLAITAKELHARRDS
jgi:transcriptional regulator with XRE-family HTH domain